MAHRTAADRLERSAGFWVRAYPPRWRRMYGDEIVTLLVELAPQGARRISAGAAWDLLRNGWAVRLRGRPDPLSWVLYRVFDLPIRRCNDWVADDIEGRWYLVRRHVPVWSLVAAMVWLVIAEPYGRAGAAGFFAFLAMIVSAVPLIARPTRRQARTRHLLQEDPPPGPPFYGREA